MFAIFPSSLWATPHPICPGHLPAVPSRPLHHNNKLNYVYLQFAGNWRVTGRPGHGDWQKERKRKCKSH